jgi:hypothetical protein
MTDLDRITLPSSSDMELLLAISDIPMGQTRLFITITVSTILSLGKRSELLTRPTMIEKLTNRYGDPGFHRHVDAAKILGLLCMSLSVI